MIRQALLLTSVAACCVTIGCASSEDVRALRLPTLPPERIALADSGSPAFENISVYEFRVMDGETDTALVSTRPTRRDVIEAFSDWLSDSRLLAPSLADSRYLLNITFEELRGPDVIPFSDKQASAIVHLQLVERLSGAVVMSSSHEVSLRARMPGITPEMTRAAAISGFSAGFVAYGANEASSGLSNAQAGVAGGVVGAIAGLVAAAPDGLPPEQWDSPEVLGSFSGTDRRETAVDGMLRQSFNHFLFDLEDRGWLTIRAAVTCASLNPDGMRGPAIVTSTMDSVAYDCP